MGSQKNHLNKTVLLSTHNTNKEKITILSLKFLLNIWTHEALIKTVMDNIFFFIIIFFFFLRIKCEILFHVNPLPADNLYEIKLYLVSYQSN